MLGRTVMAEKDSPTPERIGAHEIVDRLGEGPRGIVHLGQESEDAPRVAVKTLPVDPEDPGFAERLKDVAKVSSSYVARTIDAGTQDGLSYVVREYVEGRSLAETVAADGPLSGDALERVAVGMLTALTAVHLAGFAHRGLTPSNVILTGEGLRVTDIEIGDPAGEIGYRAPEQINGLRYGPYADVFAWAATVVFAATGSAPFGHEAASVLNGEPEVGDLPEPLREVVLAALAKDVSGRPTTYTALLRLLGDASAPMPGAAIDGVPVPPAPGEGAPPTAIEGPMPVPPAILPIQLSIEGAQRPVMPPPQGPDQPGGPMQPGPAPMQQGTPPQIPMQPGPMQPGPMQPGPMQPGPMQLGPIQQGPMQPGPIQPGPMQPAPMQAGPAGQGPMQQGPMDQGPQNPVPSQTWGPPEPPQDPSQDPSSENPSPQNGWTPTVVPGGQAGAKPRKPFPIGLVAGVSAVVLLSGLGLWGASEYSGRVTFSPAAAAGDGPARQGDAAAAQGVVSNPPGQPQAEVTVPWAATPGADDNGVGPMTLPTDGATGGPQVPVLTTVPTPPPVPIPTVTTTAQPTVTTTSTATPAKKAKQTKKAKPQATVTKTVPPSRTPTPTQSATKRPTKRPTQSPTQEPTQEQEKPTQAARPTPTKTTQKPAQPKPTKTSAPPAPKKNPYTPTQVCGSGFVVQRSSSFSGGTTYQLWNNSTGQNCAVTMKTGADVGKATPMSVKIEAQGGGSDSDSGNFEYYAGPVKVSAAGKCVRYSGSAGSGSTSAGWANCG
ncbi:protein kinase [Nonomuraea phyllanthi]|uniref:Protein kinase n=2 Tax=Nonomuraea phyllanthi TaxID=2219224 RepID=A0A5C4WXZ0_9ACTN|nr:protein kinase [Nonomuraea phyllanthi]